jgi:hypothetical protein
MAYSNRTGHPSVTTVINKVATAWLPTDFYTPESSERGTAVHDWCAAYAEKRYTIPLKDEWRGYCRSFERWADEYIEEVLLTEKRLIDARLGYCGKPDLVIKMKGRDGIGLPDLKTGGKQDLPHRMQIAGYRNLYDRCNPIPTSWGGILRLKADGGRAIFDPMPNDYRSDFNLFLSALNVYRAFESQ